MHFRTPSCPSARRRCANRVFHLANRSRARIHAGLLCALVFVPTLRAQTTVTYTNGDNNSANLSTVTGTPLELTIASGTATQSGVISGDADDGGIIKTGAGTLILAGDGNGNPFYGGTTLAAGALELGAAGVLGIFGNNLTTGALDAIHFTGGTLRFSAANSSDLSFYFSHDTGQQFRFDTNGQTVTFNTTLYGAGNTLTKLGAGTLVFGAGQNYSGLTTVSAGTLQVGQGGTAGALIGNVNVAAGAELAFYRNDAYVAVNGTGGNGVIANEGSVMFSGGTATLVKGITGTGTTTVTSSTTLKLEFAGSDVIANAVVNQGTIDLGSGGHISGAISGNGSITKSAVGTSILSGENTFTNTIFVTAGTLQIGNGSSTGSIASGVNLSSGTTLAFNRTGTLTHDGIISGSGALAKSGSGTVILTANSTYTGGTTISAGTLQLGDGGTTGAVQGGIVIDHSSANLTVNRSDSFTYGYALSGVGSFTKAGSGTLTFDTDQAFTGATTVSAGTLQLGLGGTTGSVGSSFITVASGATLDIQRSNNVTLAAAIDGAGTLVKSSGAGTTLTLTQGGSIANLTVSAGTVQIGDGGATGSLSGSASLASGTTLAFNRTGNFTYGGSVSGQGSFTKSGSGTLTLTGTNIHTGGTTVSGGTLQVGGVVGFDYSTYTDINAGSVSGNITNNAAVTFGRTDDVTYAGVISGTGTVTKSNGSTLTLTGANTYSGATNVSNASTLVVNGSLGNTPVNVSGSTLVVNGTLGNGGVTLSGGSNLSGTGTIGGPVTLADGSIAPGNSPGTLTFADGLTLAANTSLNFELGTASDLIRVSGGTLAGPASGNVFINLADAGGFTAATYTLFDFSGATTSSFDASDFTLGSTISGYTYQLSLSGSTLQLVATASAVPEPGTAAAILGACATALVALRRRCRAAF